MSQPARPANGARRHTSTVTTPLHTPSAPITTKELPMTEKLSHEWLSEVRAVASQSRATAPGDRNVYLVLLRNSERDQLGVYVGMTALTPEERFQQHKEGYKASTAVKRHGVELLRPHFDHLEGIDYHDAERIEEQLAASLKRAGFWVEGGH